ncbi:hypothetical protein QQ045_014152 [Rhodiola kirilowii]
MTEANADKDAMTPSRIQTENAEETSRSCVIAQTKQTYKHQELQPERSDDIERDKLVVGAESSGKSMTHCVSFVDGGDFIGIKGSKVKTCHIERVDMDIVVDVDKEKNECDKEQNERSTCHINGQLPEELSIEVFDDSRHYRIGEIDTN